MLSQRRHFHIGDKVVYPNHGVGVIEQISSRTIGETVEKFYLLKIKASSLKVMVPFHNVEYGRACGGWSRTAKSRKSLIFLQMASATTTPTGNTGSRKTRSACAPVRCWMSPVLKGLLLLNQSKPLSFREKKMLERARYLLVSELAMAKNCEEVQVEELLSKALSKCNLRFPEASEFEA